MSDIYREQILDHYQNPRNFGKLDQSDKSGRAVNVFCGDDVGMQLKIGGKDVIADAKFNGQGCAISTAAASLLTEEVKGKTLSEAASIDQEVIIKMLGVDLSPTRLKCALIPLEALHKAIRKENI